MKVDSHIHLWASPGRPSSKGFTTGKEPAGVDGSVRAAVTEWAMGAERQALQPPPRKEEPPITPPPLPPTLPSDSEATLAAMDSVGVAEAVVVQPTIYGSDHAYVLSCIRAHPTRFRGVLLPDVSEGPDAAVASLNALHAQGRTEDGASRSIWVGVRIYPELLPEADGPHAGARLGGPTALALARAAHDLGLSVGVLCKGGLVRGGYLLGLKALLEASETWGGGVSTATAPPTVIVDHLGFCRGGSGLPGPSGGVRASPADADEWEALESLGRSYRGCHLKLAAWFRLVGKDGPAGDVAAGWAGVEDDPPPRGALARSLGKAVRHAVMAFGPKRTMWGTDWPWVQAEYGRTIGGAGEVGDGDRAASYAAAWGALGGPAGVASGLEGGGKEGDADRIAWGTAVATHGGPRGA